MEGLGITLDLKELEKMVGILNQISLGEKKDQLLVALGGVGESFIRRRISEEKTAPDGSAWPEWSPVTAAMRSGNQSLLQYKGDLLDSIHNEPSGFEVFVGSEPLPYAAIQNFGGYAGRNNSVYIPAREWAGVSDENEQEIIAIIDKVLFNIN